MLAPFAHTVPCSRPAVAARIDDFGNEIAPAVAEIEFSAAFVPAYSAGGTQIVDGVLREMTVTKPTLFAESHPAVKSGDRLMVDGEPGWEVDGDPAVYTHPWSGWQPPMVIELRRSVG